MLKVKRSKPRESSKQHIRYNDNLLRNIFDNAVDGLITIDHTGIVEAFNPACEKMFGYQADEVIGRNIKMLMPEHYATEHNSYITNYRKTHDAKIIGIGREVQGMRKNGEVFPVDLSVSEIMVRGKQIFSGIVRDITERKQSEEQMERMIAKLSESNAELERFAYIASHDLQEPLRMVRNFTALLKKKYGDTLDEKAHHYMNVCVESVSVMQDSVDDLLEYARISEDAERLESVDMDRLVKHVLENLQETILEEKAEIKYDALPVITGNYLRLLRVMQNLIGNSIKYRKQDAEPVIHIGVIEKENKWEFSVKDNAIGLDPKYCEQIFLPFKRLHAKHEYRGTGIGLAVCRKLVDKMGGSIWATSELGEGSVFYFSIPKMTMEQGNASHE